MGLTKEQSISQYGTEAYTAWDAAGALEDAKKKGLVKTSAPTTNVPVQNFNQYLSDVSAKDLAPAVTPSYTTNTGSTVFVNGLTSQVDRARQTLDQSLVTQRTQTQAELASAKAKETAALGEVQKLTTPFRQDLETAQREKYGTEGVLSDQKGLLSELDQLLTEGNTLIKQQQETTGLASIRNPRIQKTMDDVTARAGVINAVVSLQNTYLSNAYTAIDRSVNAITQDRQEQLSYYNTILNLANRDIVTLSADDKKLAEQQTSLLANDLTRAQETADYVKKLMINPDTALALAQSGVTLNDSVEDINQKLAQFQYSKDVRTMANEMAKSDYSVVTNPKSVPASRLVTITDSKGNKYYYQKALTGSGSGFDTTNFFKTLTDMGYKVTGADTKDAPIIDTSSIWNEVINSDNSTYAGKPNFSPMGGLGTKWTDSSGKVWVYSTNGWTSSSPSSAVVNIGVGAN